MILSLLLTKFHNQTSENTQLQSQPTCDYCSSSRRRMIFFITRISHLQLFVLCMRGSNSASEGCNWRMHIFKAAHTPHPWINLSELAPNHIHTCCVFGTVRVCTLRLCSVTLRYRMWVWGGSTWPLIGMRGVDLIVHDWYSWFIPPNPASFALLLQVHCSSATASGHEITKNLSVTAKCTNAMNFSPRNWLLWGSRRGGLKGWGEAARNEMKVEHVEWRGRNCCAVSKGEGEKRERGGTQRVKPPFLSQRKK